MKRPNPEDYLTTDQLCFDEKQREYTKALEKYVDYLEAERPKPTDKEESKFIRPEDQLRQSPKF